MVRLLHILVMLVSMASIYDAQASDVPVRLTLQLPEEIRLPADLLPHVCLGDSVAKMRTALESSDLETVPELEVKKNSDDHFEFSIPANDREFSIIFHRPGWLRLFEAGPFTASDVIDGGLTIKVPRASSIQATFMADEEDRSRLPFGEVRLSLYRYIPAGGGSRLLLNQRDCVVGAAKSTYDDLPPGRYIVRVQTLPRSGDTATPTGQIDHGRFFDYRHIELEEGDQVLFDSHYRPFDAQAYRGKRNVKVTVRDPSGVPIVGKQLRIKYFDGHYGVLAVPCEPLSDKGVVMLESITERPSSYPTYQYPAYQALLDGEAIGLFDVKPVNELQNIEFRVAPRVGDMAPDVELLNTRTGKSLRLSDCKGKLVFLEFWATWCGPCQPAMTKLNQLVAANQNGQLDRVRILPISVDDRPDSASPHFSRRGWDHLDSYWSGGSDDPGFFASPAATTFGVEGVPTALLIDSRGAIVWRGNPDEIDLLRELKVSEE